MAIPYSNLPTHQKPFSVLLAIFITFFLSIARKVNSDTSYSFNYVNFTNKALTFQGDAKVLASGVLALTSREGPSWWKTGRVFHPLALDIWDNTGNVASFVTSFSFVVEDYAGYKPADGIIFFIAPPDTQIPSNSSGGKLGVVDGNNAFNQFVGVEFDSYVNDWDPNYAHVGISVNSLISLKTVRWNRVSGSLVKVSIIYDSLSKTLSVVVTDNTSIRVTTVSQVVDLKALLPQKVNFGFSATTTGGGRETHEIHSWSFTRTLVTSTITEYTNNIASYA